MGSKAGTTKQVRDLDYGDGAARVAILGSGSWGTALAALLAAGGHSVRLWAREPALAGAIGERRENLQYLPGIRLPAGIAPTAELRIAVKARVSAIFAVPSGGMGEVARAAAGVYRAARAADFGREGS